MKHYVGLDVSLETTAICVIDDQGQTLEMTSASSDPHAIAKVLRRYAKKVVRIVLESGQLSTWLTRELRAASSRSAGDLCRCSAGAPCSVRAAQQV